MKEPVDAEATRERRDLVLALIVALAAHAALFLFEAPASSAPSQADPAEEAQAREERAAAPTESRVVAVSAEDVRRLLDQLEPPEALFEPELALAELPFERTPPHASTPVAQPMPLAPAVPAVRPREATPPRPPPSRERPTAAALDGLDAPPLHAEQATDAGPADAADSAAAAEPTSPADGPYLEEAEVEALLVTMVKPRYPLSAQRRGAQGAVVVELRADARGVVTDVRIAQSSGHADLDRAAREAAQRWRFDTVRPIAERYQVRLRFELVDRR